MGIKTEVLDQKAKHKKLKGKIIGKVERPIRLVPAIDPLVLTARKLPSEILFQEARRRKAKLIESKGLYATMKKFRRCAGCNQEYSTRELRSHHCPSGLGWKKRYSKPKGTKKAA